MNVFKKIWHKLFKQPGTTNSVEKAIQGINKKNSDRLNNDIQELDKQKEKLAEKLGEITKIELSDISDINKSLEKLNHLFNEKSPRKVIFIFYPPKSTQPFEDLLSINNLLKQFQDREKGRQRKEALHKKEIKSKLDQIETLIDQDKLNETNSLINKTQNQINASYTHEIGRLRKLKQKLKDRDFEILRERQEKEKRERDEEAKRLREIEEKRQDELRKQREAKEREKRAKEEKERQAKTVLEALFVRKTNWEQFQEVLHKNGITTLYHFTDRANVKSIKENGGLYSWDYCDRHGITIPSPGGDSLSRDLDKRYSLQDYVRLSFCNDHPMMHVAIKDRRIQNYVILTISLDVCYFNHTQFSDMNATKNGHSHGKELANLRAIHFNAVKQNKQFDLSDDEKPYFQAEVLVKTGIPLKYITNINSF
jgi:uncharacterized protein YdcH (DUF465 family)